MCIRDRWYPKEKQGTALGIFGAGNVGAAVTKFAAPVIMVLSLIHISEPTRPY